MGIERRLDELERRVAALETLEDSRRPAVPQGTTAGDTFWALNALRSVAPESGSVMLVGTVPTPAGPVEWQESAPGADLVDDDWSSAADALAALGHPVRLRLLREIVRRPSTAKELGELDDVGSSGQVYHHLKALTAAGWLRHRPGGRHEVPQERLVPLLAVVMGSRR